MNVLIVTNLNGIGLQRDYELVAGYLVECGHTVTALQYDAPPDDDAVIKLTSEKYDLTIFLEVIPRNLVELSPVNWAFLNPEWCKPDVIKMAERHIDKIFAKTKEAKRVLEERFPGKVHYTGFLTADKMIREIPRKPWFLHIGGNSSMRGTQAVVDAWKWKKAGQRIDRHLVVVSSVLQDRPQLSMVTYQDRITEEELTSWQNECMFHIYPSSTEGFGHAIHESLSVGAILLVTDAPPMNEILNSFPLKATKTGKNNLADLYEVSALEIYDSVIAAQKVFEGVFPVLGFGEAQTFARAEFEQANRSFREAFAIHLQQFDGRRRAPAVRTSKTNPTIAFIGNFKASESTENMVRWALEERLGYDVEQLQENEVNLPAIRSACSWADALLWIKTPGWLRVPDHEMLGFLDELKIPSFSIHLDKFWGIPEREVQIGVHPFWKTKYVFTADGSAQEKFAERGVNHFWMKPAVSEVYCHPGWTWDMYRCDVGFVGAKEYHHQYPFRRELVEFLERTYGERFKHITDLRGHGLNDFYASCKVVVGDCIFAGTPRYWSDRVPETVGRFGTLLHPIIEGLDIGTYLYNPQDLDSLRDMIEVILTMPEFLRRDTTRGAAEAVKRDNTWTVRMRWILNHVMGAL